MLQGLLSKAGHHFLCINQAIDLEITKLIFTWTD